MRRPRPFLRALALGAVVCASLATASSATAAAGAGQLLLVSPPNSSDPGDTAADVVPAISGSGLFVAYLFEASFRGPSEVTPGAALYLTKVGGPRPIPVDVPTGEKNGNGFEAGSPALDQSGDRLAFVSENPEISTEDKDFSTSAAGTHPVRDAFVFERATRKAQLVSRATGLKGAVANADSNLPAISSDGRYVAFGTEANNLVPRSRYGRRVYGGVFVRDLQSKTTTLVSLADGRDGAPLQGWDPSISGSGARVAFAYLAGARKQRHQAIYVRDVKRGRTMVVSHQGARDCVEPALADNGRFVAYTCEAESRSKGVDQVYVTDLTSGRTALVSRGAGKKGKPGGGDSSHPSISGDGRTVAFESYANDLGPADGGRVTDVFVKDTRSGRILLASQAAGGGPAGNAPSANPSISSSGEYVSFESKASNLVAEDSDRNSSVFRYQLP